MGLEKIQGVAATTAQSIEHCLQAGVRLGLGADLLSHEFHPYQGGQLALRGQFQTPINVLRSATTVNAEILQMTGKLGCIRPGAHADMLMVDRDPFEDLAQFADPASLRLIMKGGVVVSSSL